MNLQTPRAKRALGQNFLQDTNIARKIVSLAQIQPGDQVLEIGPGPGALTRHLENPFPGRIVLVEKDQHWALERKKACPEASVILADALTIDWGRFSTPWKFIGNLPYNVASPLMWDVFGQAAGLARAVFMVQKEVGQRIAASPGTSQYGALSVWIQSFAVPRIEFIVPPHVFRPRPKVDSAVLSFTVLPEGSRAGFNPVQLARTLHACFQKRRKQLGSIIRAVGGSPAEVETLGFNLEHRPEVLTVEQFHLLSRTGFFR